MKSNKNPLILTEMDVLSMGIFGNPGDGGISVSKNLAYNGLGVASKWGKDQMLIKKIMAKYPDAQSLIPVVSKVKSTQATQLIVRLQNCHSPEEYKTLIRKYICKGTFGRYLLHFIFGTWSTAANAIDAGVNQLDDTDSAIQNKLV